MTPFVERFPEVGPRETRSIRVSGQTDLPDGEYGFLELYCNEPGCDCRRVIIDVLRPETSWNKVWATIGYGWESEEYYKAWMGDDSDDPDLTGPYLDMLNPQSDYSDALLEVFRWMLESPDYVERLKRHYRMFRESVESEAGGGRVEKKRPNYFRRRRRR